MALPVFNRLLLLINCCLFSVVILAQKTDTRPNVIFIMVDDMGYADLGSYGRKDYQTPHIDQLAAEGMKFSQAYAAAPVCTPTRAGFMTGKYPSRTLVGLYEPLVGNASDSMIGLQGTPTVASLLQAAGYQTILIGKWHLGFMKENSPLQNGFNEFFGFKGGFVDFISHRGAMLQPDLFDNDVQVFTTGYITDILTDKAIAFLNRKHEKPFFLSLQYNAPHWPWQAPVDAPLPDSVRNPPDMIALGKVTAFMAMMQNLDDNIGRLLSVLKASGLKENTLLIFVSDNGGERFSDMGPLQGKKMSLWEGGIRVPSIVSWPGRVPEGVVSDQPVITMDWTATILELAGINTTSHLLDGVSLLELIKDPSKKIERTFYWRTYQRTRQKAVRVGKWKYLKDEKGEYLFNLGSDPGETKDLKNEEAQLFSRLKNQLSDWEKTVLPPVPLRSAKSTN